MMFLLWYGTIYFTWGYLYNDVFDYDSVGYFVCLQHICIQFPSGDSKVYSIFICSIKT